MRFILCLAVLGSLVPAWAHADFRYVPHAPVPVAPNDAPPAASSGSMMDNQSTPMNAPAQNQAAMAQPEQMVEPMPLNSYNNPSRIMGPPPLQPQSASPPVVSRMVGVPATTSMSGGEVAQGFGKSVPLVMALREIVPQSYQIGYGTGVGLGTMVDWQGGQGWRDVLNATLSPLGLMASECGSLIYIDRAGMQAASAQ